MSLSKDRFNQLTLTEKHELLKNEGEFIASRRSEGFFVHLFSLNNEYVEMWMNINLNQVMWIEFPDNTETLKLYTDDIDPKKDLGIS